MSKTKKFMSLLVVVMLLLGSAVGCSSNSNEKKEIVLIEGAFAEISIINHMLGILIEENTKLKVKYHDSMSTVAYANAVKSKEIDIGMSYDGTLLTTILGHDPKDVPPGEDLFVWTKAAGSKEKGITLHEKFGFENTYALAVRQETADKYNLKTISDLRPYTKDLVFGSEHEFFDENGTMRFIPFNKKYDLKWKDSKSLDIGLKYTAIDSKNIDVTMVYSTDGLNKKSNLVVLEDDLKFFPQYYGAFLIRDTLFDEFKTAAPNLKEVMSKLSAKIDNETMINLNYAVDAEKKKPADVAKAFLVEKGLSKK